MQWNSTSIELDLASVQWACCKEEKKQVITQILISKKYVYFIGASWLHFTKMTETNKADIQPAGDVYTNIPRNTLCGKDTVR